MGWSLTSIAARLGGAVGIGGRWAAPYSAAHAAGRAQRGSPDVRDDVFSRGYARRLAASGAADAKALRTAHAEVGDDAAVVERAVVSGAPVAAVASLAAAWDGLSESTRAVVRAPAGADLGAVKFGTVRATQVDETTCGAAAMAMMLMTGDPLVGAWLMTGRHFGEYLPPEVLDVVVRHPEARTIDERWRALQRVIHRDTTRRGLLFAPWPRRFGTPPWRVDDETRFAGVRFRGAVLDDGDVASVTAAIAHAAHALRDGIPVPLFTGGDSSGGLAHVVPRHVVLLTGRTDHGFRVYEPSTGRSLPLSEARMFGPGPKEPAYGKWTRACWMVLPQVRKRD